MISTRVNELYGVQNRTTMRLMPSVYHQCYASLTNPRHKANVTNQVSPINCEDIHIKPLQQLTGLRIRNLSRRAPLPIYHCRTFTACVTATLLHPGKLGTKALDV